MMKLGVEERCVAAGGAFSDVVVATSYGTRRQGVPDMGIATFVDLSRRHRGLVFGPRWMASGGRCQWVLDTISQMVEWPHQPLRFNSVVLRTAPRPNIVDGIISLLRDGTHWSYSPA